MLAAGLKTQQLLADVQLGDGLLSSLWFRVLLIEVEADCGLALLLGVCLRFFRVATQVLFVAFIAFSACQTAFGAQSCGCLGRVHLAPMTMVGVDGVLLLGLCKWKPSNAKPGRVGLFRLAAIVGVFAFFPAVAWLAAGPTSHGVEVSPSLVDLGVLQQGERREFTVLLNNRRNETVAVERMAASCPCLEAAEGRYVLAPRDELSLPLDLDLSKEPEFTGPLLIELRGWTALEEVAFVVRIELRVVPNGDQPP